jgi:hypothetical protein
MTSKPVALLSIEDAEHNRCVDLFSRSDGSFGFEEYRRDVEDGGVWTRVQYFSPLVYASLKATLTAAMRSVGWLEDAVNHSPGAREILS